MAHNTAHIAAPPERVFEVLSDPDSYAHWVVGSKKIRDADPGWPGLGTKFHHTVGVGPLRVGDDTQVLEVDPPRRLVLQARARPLGTARITLRLAPDGAGTRVEFTEEAGDLLSRVSSFNPLVDPLVHKRNDTALRRLKELAERR